MVINLVIIFLVSLVPGILWVRFFHLKDKFEREPVTLLVRVFLFGAAAVGFAAVLEMPFRTWVLSDAPLVLQFVVAFLVIGLGEEFLKAVAVYLAVYRSKDFNEEVDGIIYAVTAGIGFSVVENILYASSYGLAVAPIRALVASLAHACFSGIFGAYLGRAKFSDQPGRELIKGVIYAGMLHGLYDFILISQLLTPFFAIILVGVLYFVLQRLIDNALAKSPFQ